MVDIPAKGGVSVRGTPRKRESPDHKPHGAPDGVQRCLGVEANVDSRACVGYHPRRTGRRVLVGGRRLPRTKKIGVDALFGWERLEVGAEPWGLERFRRGGDARFAKMYINILGGPGPPQTTLDYAEFKNVCGIPM